MLLSLRNVTKTYEDKTAVDNLSLNVPRGVIYGIIGPNGAGKTTTIRMVMNITAPDSGEIVFEQNDSNFDFRDRVGYLPEERGLYKKMTCAEVITYMSALKGFNDRDCDKKIDQWLEKIGLIEYKNKKVEELSKGMQQKLQFVTTIFHEPDIIILDEIFSGLDPINIELIKNILMDLKREGKTVLFSTHVMEQAEKLCDNICMISKGSKVLDGSLTNIKKEFGKNNIQIDIEGDGNFIRHLNGVKSMIESNNNVEIQLTEGAQTNEILKAVVEKVQVNRFEIVEPSLYDIFIDMANIDPASLNNNRGEGHV